MKGPSLHGNKEGLFLFSFPRLAPSPKKVKDMVFSVKNRVLSL